MTIMERRGKQHCEHSGCFQQRYVTKAVLALWVYEADFHKCPKVVFDALLSMSQ